MLKLTNKQARHLWLHSLGLSATPIGPLDLPRMIQDLGFVQIDTIRNVTRAHHHILWTRNQNYREKQLWPMLKDDRHLFEHFTHDASLIPMEFYPMWQRQYRRLGEKVAQQDWYQSGLARDAIRDIHERIRAEGPLSTHAFDTKIEGPREIWARPPHKKALDQLWYGGTLTTSHRENFTKFYDLSERVIPETYRQTDISDQDQINWLCDSALDRLTLASPGEVQRFWAATDAPEVKAWRARRPDLVPVDYIAADKSIHTALAPPDIETRLAKLPPPSSRLRLLNPFDPAIRDRIRLARLFGFDYRNEMFVPKDQRKWGYYVYPLLEGDRFVGRIEAKGDRPCQTLTVTGFWPEPGVDWPASRGSKLAAELGRFGRLAGLTKITWACAAPKGA
jgi:uncharacterized protein YcaQ